MKIYSLCIQKSSKPFQGVRWCSQLLKEGFGIRTRNDFPSRGEVKKKIVLYSILEFAENNTNVFAKLKSDFGFGREDIESAFESQKIDFRRPTETYVNLFKIFRDEFGIQKENPIIRKFAEAKNPKADAAIAAVYGAESSPRRRKSPSPPSRKSPSPPRRKSPSPPRRNQ